MANYIIPIPFLATANDTISDVVMASHAPTGVPSALGTVGRSENGAPVLDIVTEIPASWVRSDSLTKKFIEKVHIQRLAVDCRCATGTELFHAIEEGTDPPDIFALTGEDRQGWELTTLSIEQRTAAHALLLHVRGRLILQQRHRVGHLSGYALHVWFGTADDPTGLPFRKNDESALNELTESLIAYKPDPTALLVDGPELPARLNLQPVRTPSDASYYAVPLLGGAPASPFFAMTGFELHLAFQSRHEAPAAWQTLREQIAHKDKPKNDRLLISVGAPKVSGLCFPAEEVLGDFLLKHHEPVGAQHLESVILHLLEHWPRSRDPWFDAGRALARNIQRAKPSAPSVRIASIMIRKIFRQTLDN